MQKKDKRKFIVIAKVGNENFVKYVKEMQEKKQ